MASPALALERHDEIDDRVGRWLLTGPAQVREGLHAGAVAGCLKRHGAAAYVYPEITGYYLQWLAWRARNWGATPELASAATDAQHWLATWLRLSDPPHTRLEVGTATPDWRNDAVFCFDVAMVLRGLAAAASSGLLAPDRAVVAGVVAQLERLVGADGLFAACIPNHRHAQLPDRWSTRRGPFLAKAAAGIIVAARDLDEIPPALVDAAQATFNASLRWFVDAPHDDVHPMLYACEGMLSMPEHPRFGSMLPAMGREVDRLLHLAGPDGALPEAYSRQPPAANPARVDVLGQLLRAGVLLGVHRPQDPPDRLALERLRHALERQMLPEGAFRFAMHDETASLNVWATMFGDQALCLAASPRLAAAARDGDPLLV